MAYFSPFFTEGGLLLHEKTLAGRLGAAGWKSILNALTVREVPQPGAPAAALMHLRTHWCYRRPPLIPGAVELPRRAAVCLAGMGAFTPQEQAGLHMQLRHVGGGPSGGEGCYVSRCGRLENYVRVLPARAARIETQLYDYQRIYVEYLVRARLTAATWQNGNGQVYVQLDTGLGKTYLALALVAALRLPTLFVVPTLQLQSDGADTARELFPHLNVVSYSNVEARRCEKKGLTPPGATNADIIFCVVNTASKKPPEFFMGFGLIILDEVHEFHARTLVKLLEAPSPYLVGLSATPLIRPNKLDRIVPMYLGKPLSLLDVLKDQHGEAGAEEMIKLLEFKFDGVVREVWYEGHPATLEPGDLQGPPLLPIQRIGRIICDPHRIELIAAEVERILHLHETLPPDQLDYWGLGLDEHGVVRRHSVFVFAEHRDYLPTLRKALLRRVDEREFYLMDPEEDPDASSAVVLRGGASEEDRRGARHTRVVLTTYGYSRRGVSFEHMTALVEATPRRNGYMQILGRICRLTRDPSLRSIRRIVVDVRDTKSPLDSQSSGRRPVYREKNWGVSYVRNTFEDFKLEPAPPSPAHPLSAEKAVKVPNKRRGKASGGSAGSAACSQAQSAELQPDSGTKAGGGHSLQDLLHHK